MAQSNHNNSESLRKKLYTTMKEFNDLIWKVADSDPMVQGSFYYVQKTCSKKNCCCKKGQKHGPFPALSQSINGKRKLVMIKKEDEEVVARKAHNYKIFQKRLTKLRKIIPRIDLLLQNIRSTLIEEYPWNER
jgi:hypothetical protein